VLPCNGACCSINKIKKKKNTIGIMAFRLSYRLQNSLQGANRWTLADILITYHKTLLLCTLSYLMFFLSNYSLITLSVFSSSLFTSYTGRGVKFKGPQGTEESKRPFILCDRGNRISRIHFATRNCYITVSNRLNV
jgi:hypothetical protein